MLIRNLLAENLHFQIKNTHCLNIKNYIPIMIDRHNCPFQWVFFSSSISKANLERTIRWEMQTKPRNLERYETFLYQNKERVRTASLKRGLVTNAPPPPPRFSNLKLDLFRAPLSSLRRQWTFSGCLRGWHTDLFAGRSPSTHFISLVHIEVVFTISHKNRYSDTIC